MLNEQTLPQKQQQQNTKTQPTSYIHIQNNEHKK